MTSMEFFIYRYYCSNDSFIYGETPSGLSSFLKNRIPLYKIVEALEGLVDLGYLKRIDNTYFLTEYGNHKRENNYVMSSYFVFVRNGILEINDFTLLVILEELRETFYPMSDRAIISIDRIALRNTLGMSYRAFKKALANLEELDLVYLIELEELDNKITIEYEL